MARGINSIASLINGFNQGYDTTSRVMRDIDIAKISNAKQENVLAQADLSDPEAPMAPNVAKFLGQTYDKPLDEAGMSKARSLAMAGVLEKYGDVAGGQGMRERIAAQALNEERAARERELYPLQLEGAKLGLDNSRIQNRSGKRSEAKAESVDALNKEVGDWMKSRLTGADGNQRAATPDDYLEGAQYRIAKLVSSGHSEEAMMAMKEHQAAALGKIHLDTAQRNMDADKASAAIASGNYEQAAQWFNRYAPDGSNASAPSVGKDGSITFQRTGVDGKKLEPHRFKNKDELIASINQVRDPTAMFKFSQAEIANRFQQQQLAVSQAHLGLAQASGGRAQAEFDAGAPDRETKGKIAKLKGELADADETTPEGKKRIEQIHGKLQALSTGTRGGGAAAHDPADVAKARVLVSGGQYPDVGTALIGLVQRPDQQHQRYVELSMKNGTTDPAKAVAIADKAMSASGWARSGSSWSKTGGPSGGAPAGGPQKGAVVDGHVFQGGNPNDPNAWKKQ